ncbi:Dor1-domain-containing protein [Trametes sanguinea]|nr:Dor1-domain-containing protein [Trametes sanguinea]
MDAMIQDNDIPTLPELLASSSQDSLDPSSLASPAASSYISRLTSLSLQELEAEPTELSSSSAQLTNALTTLCYTSYPTFLSLHTTTSTLSSSLDALSSSLSSLLSALPSLESSARTFAQDSRSLLASRRKAALVLEHHDKLHDVLSLPLLLETSVRNHNYSDALLLAQHASTLASRFPSNPLVQSVKADCDVRVHSMLAQLLRVLHEQAKLPALFRAVGFLRKMNVLSEQELALAFLSGRSAYLDGTLRAVEIEKKGIDGEGSVEREREIYSRYLKRYIDAWREGVHDVVTQYTTIFLDRSHNAEPAPSELHVLLTTFTTLRTQQLLDLLRETLPLVADPSLLSSLLTQLTYCATSFARVGLDFRAALGPLFISAVRNGVTREFEDASDVWSRTLESREASRTRSQSGPSARKKPSQLFLPAASTTTHTFPTAAQLESLASSPPNVPPPILASYTPLAVYTNALLSALNGLRLLAPASLLHDLLTALDGALARATTSLLSYMRASADDRNNSTTTPSAEEKKREEDVVRAVGTVILPQILQQLLAIHKLDIDMGNEVSRARGLTVASFLTNFAVQTYGMITTPNMKDVAEANHFAFSPNPWFIAAFFSGQVVLQLAWIRKLFQQDPPGGYQAIGTGGNPELAAKEDERAWKVALSYAPIYALGNFCIAGWLFFWLREEFTASQVLVTINTVAQLLAVAALPPLTPNSSTLMRLTHYVAKTFAGIGVLDLVDNGGVALMYRAPPSTLVQAASYAFFPLAAAASKPLFGSILLYDVIAIAVGQMGVLGAEPWPTRLGWTALATAGVVGVKAVPVLKEYLQQK